MSNPNAELEDKEFSVTADAIFIYMFPFEIIFILYQVASLYKRLLFCTSDHVQNAVYPLNDNGSVNTAVTWVRIHTAVRQ